MQKALGFLLMALPATAGFATYGMTKDKGMNVLVGALLAGAAYAATDILGAQLSGGGIAGLTLEKIGVLSMQKIGALAVNPAPRTYAALTAQQKQNLGYLVPQKVGACFGSC